MNEQENRDYLNSLQPGEEVIETGRNCNTGMKGTVYRSPRHGALCVMWENNMGTSVTHGTRRVSENPVLPEFDPPPKPVEGSMLKLVKDFLLAISEDFGKEMYLSEKAYLALIALVENIYGPVWSRRLADDFRKYDVSQYRDQHVWQYRLTMDTTIEELGN